MTDMSLFNSGEFGEMRTCCDPKSGEVWFNLNDACRALDLTNPRMVKSRLDDDVSQTYTISDSLGREQNATKSIRLPTVTVPPSMSVCSQSLASSSVKKIGSFIMIYFWICEKKYLSLIQAKVRRIFLISNAYWSFCRFLFVHSFT